LPIITEDTHNHYYNGFGERVIKDITSDFLRVAWLMFPATLVLLTVTSLSRVEILRTGQYAPFG
jgi:hypothetical protein